MTTATPEQRRELKRLAEAATARPWVTSGSAIDGVGLTMEYADAAYIVAACNAIPALLADLEAADTELRNAAFWVVRAKAAEDGAERLLARAEALLERVRVLREVLRRSLLLGIRLLNADVLDLGDKVYAESIVAEGMLLLGFKNSTEVATGGASTAPEEAKPHEA